MFKHPSQTNADYWSANRKAPSYKPEDLERLREWLISYAKLTYKHLQFAGAATPEKFKRFGTKMKVLAYDKTLTAYHADMLDQIGSNMTKQYETYMYYARDPEAWSDPRFYAAHLRDLTMALGQLAQLCKRIAKSMQYEVHTRSFQNSTNADQRAALSTIYNIAEKFSEFNKLARFGISRGEQPSEYLDEIAARYNRMAISAINQVNKLAVEFDVPPEHALGSNSLYSQIVDDARKLVEVVKKLPALPHQPQLSRMTNQDVVVWLRALAAFNTKAMEIHTTASKLSDEA